MTPDNDAMRAFDEIVNGFSNGQKNGYSIRIKTIRAALQRSAQVDGLVKALEYYAKNSRSWISGNEDKIANDALQQFNETK